MQNSTFRRVALVLSLALAVVVVTLGAMSFQRRVATFQPLGFETAQLGAGWLVTAVGDSTTGLEPGDVLMLVDGHGATTRVELRELLHRKPASQLEVLRGEAPVPVSFARPALDLDTAYLLLALIGTVFLLIGFVTLLKSKQRHAWLFYLWCLSYALVFLVSPTDEGSLDRWLYLLEDVGRILLPALTVHLFLVFPRELDRGSWTRRAIPFFYLPSAVLAALHADLTLDGSLLLHPKTQAALETALLRLESFGRFYLVAYSLLAAALLAYRVRRHKGWKERKQVQWIALGTGAGYVPFLLYLLAQKAVPAAGWTGTAWLSSDWLSALVVLPLALVPLTFAWAILQYKLWDIDVIVRDTASYSVTALLGVAAFSLVNLGISRGLPEGAGLVRNLASFSAGLMIAALVAPAHRRVSTALERLHYRTTFARRRELGDFADEMLHERDLGRLCESLLESLTATLQLRCADLYLLGTSDLAAVRAGGKGPQRLERDALGTDLWTREVSAISPFAVPEAQPTAAQTLFKAGYRYAFPLRVRDQPVGLLVIGYKGDQRPLNSDDEELVRSLLSHAALAIENAELMGELHHQLDEVRRLQSYNQDIIDASPAGIAVVDPAGRIVSANPAFERISGRARTALVGVVLEEVLPIRPLPQPGSGPMDASYCDAGGEEHYLELSVGHLRPGAGDEMRIVMVHDVSQRVALENALREQDRLASLGMLAAGVAHEVNTPLTGISSYAQMLLRATPEQDSRHGLLKKVEQQTFRAARILNNLLEFARNRKSEYAAVSLGSVVTETLDLLRERLSKGRVRVEWREPAEPAVVKGSEGELQQVLTNLVLNALDALRESGGTLVIDLQAAPETYLLRVADDGPGIPAERLEKIFQPFFSTKLNRGGTGLGLSISYDIVRRHGGEIEVESELGAGTRFLIALPRHS